MQEAEHIEAAFGDAVGQLFHVLVEGLSDGPHDPTAVTEAERRFKLGLEIARSARLRALALLMP